MYKNISGSGTNLYGMSGEKGLFWTVNFRMFRSTRFSTSKSLRKLISDTGVKDWCKRKGWDITPRYSTLATKIILIQPKWVEWLGYETRLLTLKRPTLVECQVTVSVPTHISLNNRIMVPRDSHITLKIFWGFTRLLGWWGITCM